MRFGIFGSAQARRGGPDADSGVGFREFVDYNVEAEALAFHSTFLTFIAARTRTLRLGTAVIVLPWHNPVLLAEQAATLDLLSQGRLDLGIGSGYRSRPRATTCCSTSTRPSGRSASGSPSSVPRSSGSGASSTR
jgi:hypothetical protein